MSTNTDPILSCDRCGREIPIGKGYTIVNGWNICGICYWEESEGKGYFPKVKPIEP